MRNSVASAPRSTVPPINGSGSLQPSAGLRSSAPVLAVALDCGRRCEHEVDRLLDLVGERFERDDAGLADRGRHTALHAQPSLPCRVTSKLACRRGRSRSPAIRATPARTSASATRSRCCPVSGTFSNASGTFHGARPRFSDRGSRMGNRPQGWEKSLSRPSERHPPRHPTGSPRRVRNARAARLVRPRRRRRRYCVRAPSQAPASPAAASAAP